MNEYILLADGNRVACLADNMEEAKDYAKQLYPNATQIEFVSPFNCYCN